MMSCIRMLKAVRNIVSRKTAMIRRLARMFGKELGRPQSALTGVVVCVDASFIPVRVASICVVARV